MINLQLSEKRIRRNDGLLDVHSIFLTIQGEGPFAGNRAIFIRLAGCNLRCPGCDTDYTSDRHLLSVKQILDAMNMLSEVNLVVITGGEPLRQDLTNLVRTLVLVCGYNVQIETNGTLPISSAMESLVRTDMPPCLRQESGLYIVCSPKAPSVNKRLQSHVMAYKYVLSPGFIDSRDGLPTAVLDNRIPWDNGKTVFRPGEEYHGPIYVQPCDFHEPTLNEESLQHTIDICLQYGYILQLQIHKLIGMD